MIIHLLKGILSVSFTAIVIKLMDDFLDEVIEVNRGILPYSLLFFSVAVSLEPSWAVTFFFASYAIGMADDLRWKLPLSLTAFQESIIVLAIGSLVFGWFEMLTSFLLILSIQIIDDFMDQEIDLIEGRWNIIRKYGRVEAITFAAGMILLSIRFVPLKTLCTTFATAFIWVGEYFLNQHNSKKR